MDLESIRNLIVNNDLTTDLIVPNNLRTGTAFKRYCQLAKIPDVGLLYVREKPDDPEERPHPVDFIRQKLAQEISAAARFRAAGAPVPAHYPVGGDAIFEFTDRLTGVESNSLGMFVQHVDYIGLYKNYESRNLSVAVKALPAAMQSKSLNDYALIQLAASSICPRDLQILLSRSGNLFVIDIEQLGPGRSIANI